MKPLRVPLRVVFYQDDGVWVAHCLEFDLLGDGDTREEALHKLGQAIRLQVDATLDYQNPANLFSPAEGRYFRMFAAGETVAPPELKLQVDAREDIRIEQVELREFVEAEPAAV